MTGLSMSVNILLFLAGSNSFEVTQIIKHCIFLLLYLSIAFVGVLLWRNKTLGLTSSIVVQSLHLPTLNTSVIGYLFTGVVDSFVYLRFEEGLGLGFDGYVGGRYTFNILQEVTELTVGINIVALLFLLILLRARKSKDMVSTDQDA